jgi:ribonucleotide monophosphatase NagD (HAD superfamily)
VPLLQKAIARDLPMVVLNPDFVSIAPDGAMHSCPGKVGRAYEELGGTVKIHGKPSPGVYAECFRLAPGAKTALAIGDSLYHDIAGADGAGIDSVFVTSGIHAYDLGAAPGADADPAKVAALCVEYEVRPKYFATRMIW